MKLSIEKNQRFNMLFCGLLDYVSKAYDIEPWLDFSHSIPEDTEAVAAVKKYLWENDYIIDEYVLKNPNKLFINDCETIMRWKYHNTNTFFYVGDYEGFSVFADDYHFYGVVGHSREISEMLNSGGSIVPVETTLLPYGGHVVYDTTMASFPVSVGPNISEKFDDDFEIAISEDKVILTDAEFIDAMKIPQDKKEARSMIYERNDTYEEHDDSEDQGYSEEEITSALERFAQETIKRFEKSIISGQPVTSIYDILNKKTKRQLMELVSELRISGVSSYKKDQLIDILGGELYKKDYLEDVFLFLDEEQMSLLDNLAYEGITEVSLEELTNISRGNPLYEMAIFSFKSKDKYYMVLSDEFEKAYGDIMKSDYPGKREKTVSIHNMANAMVKLYGLITMDDFIEEYEKFFDLKITVDEVIKNLEIYLDSDAGLYELAGTDIVYFEIADDYSWYEDIKLNIEKKQRKSFSKEIIERNFVEDYYEEFKELKLIEEFLVKNAPEFTENEFKYDTFMGELHDYFMMDMRLPDILNYFGERDLIFDMDQTNALLSLIMNAANNTPVWGNNGWTPSELSAKSGASESMEQMPFGIPGNMRQLPVRKEEKVGRNDPCPCGSGKKYKKCCMLKDN